MIKFLSINHSETHSESKELGSDGNPVATLNRDSDGQYIAQAKTFMALRMLLDASSEMKLAELKLCVEGKCYLALQNPQRMRISLKKFMAKSFPLKKHFPTHPTHSELLKS